MRSLARVVPLSLSLLAACTNAPTPVRPTAALPATPEMATTPYTATQIRESCRVGHTIVFRTEAAGKGTMQRTIRFVAADSEGADTESTSADEAGRPTGAPKRSRATWEELRRHALFPSAQTTVVDERVATPAGAFDASKYVVRDGDEVSTFYFAKTLPGPPVLFFTEKAGARVMTTTMIAVSDAAPSR